MDWLNLVIPVLAGILGFFISKWMGGRENREDKLDQEQARSVEKNERDHRDFERRITALETKIDEVLPDLKEQLKDLRVLVADHIRKVEEYRMEVAKHIAGSS